MGQASDARARVPSEPPVSRSKAPHGLRSPDCRITVTTIGPEFGPSFGKQFRLLPQGDDRAKGVRLGREMCVEEMGESKPTDDASLLQSPSFRWRASELVSGIRIIFPSILLIHRGLSQLRASPLTGVRLTRADAYK